LPADFNTAKLLLAFQVSGCLTVLLVDRDGVSFFAVQHFDFVDGPSFLPGCGNAVFDNDLNITFLISSKITRLVVVEFLPFEVGNMRVATKCANWTPADRGSGFARSFATMSGAEGIFDTAQVFNCTAFLDSGVKTVRAKVFAQFVGEGFDVCKGKFSRVVFVHTGAFRALEGFGVFHNNLNVEVAVSDPSPA